MAAMTSFEHQVHFVKSNLSTKLPSSFEYKDGWRYCSLNSFMRGILMNDIATVAVPQQ